MEINQFFPTSYEVSRERFRARLESLRQLWPAANLNSYRLNGEEDLTIDWISAEPSGNKDNLLVFTTGEHGIEAFVGSAAFELFAQEFLPRLDPTTTGLLFIHAINPWGMKHHRRVNRQNVDLNRNFGWEPSAFNLSVNPDYDSLERFLNPRSPLKRYAAAKHTFSAGMLRRVLLMGKKRFMRATLLGQYRFPRGIYFGGSELQEETRVVTGLYRESMPAYRQIVHLDMHTGFGPSQSMTLVNSWMEPASSAELRKKFSYPKIARSNPEEFYKIQGDMIDLVYSLARREFPSSRLYATSFEYGTFGDSVLQQIRSLHAMVLENQVYWYGASEPTTRTEVEQEIMEMFNPSSQDWRLRALQDTRVALEGILGSYQLIQ